MLQDKTEIFYIVESYVERESKNQKLQVKRVTFDSVSKKDKLKLNRNCSFYEITHIVSR